MLTPIPNVSTAHIIQMHMMMDKCPEIIKIPIFLKMVKFEYFKPRSALLSHMRQCKELPILLPLQDEQTREAPG
jgi:hypothetical protein